MKPTLAFLAMLALAGCTDGPNVDYSPAAAARRAQASAAMDQMINNNIATLNGQAAQSLYTAQNLSNNAVRITSETPAMVTSEGTAYYYCRDATDQMVMCKKLN